MDPHVLLQDLVVIPGPPGAEGLVARYLSDRVSDLGLRSEIDAKGNVLVRIGSGRPKVVVTAHMDEIAMIVRQVTDDGRLLVTSLGGLYPWKIGEGPVEIMAGDGFLPGILSFGSIHTDDPSSTVQKAREKGLTWDLAHVFTGMSRTELVSSGVRPGSRVVVSRSRRMLSYLGDFVAGHFLDDRADLVSWLLVLEAFVKKNVDVVFAATSAEEVGGEGALFLLHEFVPEVCIALELGASVPDAPINLSSAPTVWVKDSYSTMSSADGELLSSIGKKLGVPLQFQALSRGGSDASCAASHGLCARPITLGLPMENSHGCEIMHRDAPAVLANVTIELLSRLLENR